ncbi:MAG TPA: DUF1800 domain-containing protein [Pyrinomonadaceae bacterium]|nr:DUF1800 domain-containing protein [Pyrinomonadaceae bacterium]
MKNRFSLIQKITAFLMSLAMFSQIFIIGASAQSMTKSKVKGLTEDQKILHVLNRLAFGARPGEVEKVKAMGLKNYIQQQLNPNSLDDSATEAKLRNFDVLKLSNDEMFAKYPAPAALLQLVAQRNGVNQKELKADVKEARQEKKDAKAGNQDGSMPANPNAGNPPRPNVGNNDAEMYRDQIQEFYQKYNLGRPQQISQELNASRILRAVYSERQLQEVMVDFWTNHFNVFANKQSVRWFLPEYDRDIIRPNALGKFKDLLMATAKSPAMLYYLDNFESVAPNTNQGKGGGKQQQLTPQQLERLAQNPQARERIKQQRGITDAQLDEFIKQAKANPQVMQQQQQRQQRGINENYAREIMELHTLGVDGGYTQKDIQEVARAFTGWTITDARGYRRAANVTGMEDKRGEQMARQMGIPANTESGKFVFVERFHDNGEKMILGQKVNEGGVNDGLKVIDMLAHHPSTAKFIAKKLAVKFVNDNPSEALVGRVADAFTKSDGDIKVTLQALFTDPEFYAPENYRAKIKTPFEVVVSGIRTIGADTNGMGIQQMLGKMGEQLYNWQAPTGYPDTAEDWVNTGALLERMNFAVALASNRIPGTKVDLAKLGTASGDKVKLLDSYVAVVLNNEVSEATKSSLLKQMEQPLPEVSMGNNNSMAMENASMQRPNAQGGQQQRGQGQQGRLLPPSGNPEVFKVVGLILGSPEFQRQ